jgi:phosphatidylethanolamine-binding protein (PEBP) family uncharacterized protein
VSLKAEAQNLGFHPLPEGRLSFSATLQNSTSRVFSLFSYNAHCPLPNSQCPMHKYFC